MINSVSAPVLTATHEVIGGFKTALDQPDIKSSVLNPVQGKPDTTSISTLARQLAESAVRAEAREKEMSREQLRAHAMKTYDQLHRSEADTWANVVAQLPDTDDPELLERARQATHYVISASRGDRSVKNPFADLTREQTALIGYDDAGPYTKHEREAALWRGGQLEQQWRVGLFARSDEESREFGTRIGFHTEILAHLKSLPAIEYVQSGGLEYEKRLLTDIARESEGLKPTDRLLTLFEVLARMGLPEFKKKHEGPTADEGVQATSKPPAATKEAALTKPAPEQLTPLAEPATSETTRLSPAASPIALAAERS